MLAERASGWCHFSHVAGGAPKELAALTKRAVLCKDTLSLSCMLLRKANEVETERAREHLPVMDEELFDDEYFDEPEYDGDARGNGWAEAFAASGLDGPDRGARNIVRILSDPIRLPDCDAPARYGCSHQGLVLVQDALRVPSGGAAAVTWPDRAERDAKSGALVVTLSVSAEKPKTPAIKKTPEPRKALHGLVPFPRRQDARATPKKNAPIPKEPRSRAPNKKGEKP